MCRSSQKQLDLLCQPLSVRTRHSPHPNDVWLLVNVKYDHTSPIHGIPGARLELWSECGCLCRIISLYSRDMVKIDFSWIPRAGFPPNDVWLLVNVKYDHTSPIHGIPGARLQVGVKASNLWGFIRLYEASYGPHSKTLKIQHPVPPKRVVEGMWLWNLFIAQL